MAQNNSVFVFVWTANSSHRRPHLRIVMNQVINLKSLGFTWKKTANLFWVSIILWSPYFCSCLFCGRQCCKTSICISCCRLANSLSNSCWTDSCWFSSISPSAMFAESINDFTISFGVFSLLITLFKRGMHWSSSIFTVLRSWLLESIVFPVYLQFH